jgi:glycosyltransferase involved in cell wall biosynthesis
VLWAALSTHTEGKRSRVRSALRRWMLRFVDAAFVNGKSGQDYLRSLNFRKPICFVPYTIDDAGFQSPGYVPSADEVRLLFCGRLDATKGILHFARVLHRWCADHPEKRVRFQVIGDGPDRDALHALPALPNLSFSLLPRMEQKDLAAFYHQADIFAFPSMLDEWGVVVNEALIAGLPVLGSVYSQASIELIADGANGWLFDPKKDAGIYAGLQRALTTPVAQLHCMSAYARCTAHEVAPKRIAQRAVQFIAEVCGVAAKAEKIQPADVALTSSSPVSAL